MKILGSGLCQNNFLIPERFLKFTILPFYFVFITKKNLLFQEYDEMFLDYNMYLHIHNQNLTFISFFASKVPLHNSCLLPLALIIDQVLHSVLK